MEKFIKVLALMKKIILSFIILSISIFNVSVHAQHINKVIRNGNDLYKQNKFADADKKYSEALVKNKTDKKAMYNKANALYKLNKYNEAVAQLKQLSEKSLSKSERTSVNHNLGNAYLKANDLDNAITSYKEALRENPSDAETRYNLAYAMQKKKNNKDNKKNKKDDKSEKENKQSEEKNDDPKANENQPKPNELSKEDAERILQALQKNEKDILDRKNRKKAKVSSSEVEKDW